MLGLGPENGAALAGVGAPNQGLGTNLIKAGDPVGVKPTTTRLPALRVATDPELWVPRLPGESLLERRARRDAARDILADLRAEADAEAVAV
jgi:hypothetical protein